MKNITEAELQRLARRALREAKGQDFPIDYSETVLREYLQDMNVAATRDEIRDVLDNVFDGRRASANRGA